MIQLKKNCRRMWLTLFLLLVAATASILSVNAAEDTADDTAEIFKMTYLLDGEVFEEQEYQEGDTIAAPEAPDKPNFIFTEWANLPETMPASDQTASASYTFDGTLVTDLNNVYECYLEVSDEIAVTMYLRINEEGNFVFSRSTDFSSTEKGAGKVYRKSEQTEITGGTYAVDISWSPMVGMFEPVLEIDAEHMTFQLYGAADPDTGKGNGTVAYTDGVYTLNFTDGNTTTFTYEDGVITFTSKLWYGTASFDQRDEEENFVSYQAELTAENETHADAASDEEHEGSEEDDAAVLTAAPGEYCLVYYVVDGESVALGTHISTFEVQEDGSILFTSPFWFGATTPKFIAEDETVTYPEFIISEKEIEQDIDAESIVSKEDLSQSDLTEEEENQNGDSTGFQMGTYGGTYTTTAMGSSLTYACTITFREDGTYSYTVKFNMMGETYTESESGTYQVNGSSITLTSSDGTTMSGTISGSSVTITRMASSFAFSPATITFTYGTTPGVTASNANPNETETEKDSTKETEKESEAQKETENTAGNQTTVTGEGGITGGTYQVDVSWSPMGSMFTPILSIDAENMTFQIYNASAPETSKGSGTISHKDGVYTLQFENGNTTTFTYKDKTITFTSPLYFGKASFNSAGDDGVFVPYTGELKKEQTADTPQETETEKQPETETEKVPESETEEVKQPESETEKETESEAGGNETAVLKTGTYTGTYTKMAMGSPVVYTFTMELKADGTYTHSVKFPMGGTEYTETETGSYTVENGTITLNAASGTDLMGQPVTAGTVGTGTVQDNGTITIIRKASSMASSATEIVYSFGTAGETTPPSETPDTEPKEDEVKFQTGTYGGTYTSTSSSGSQTQYAYTLTFNADGTYIYQVNFAAMGSNCIQKETGTYTASQNEFTLSSTSITIDTAEGENLMKPEAGETMTGIISQNGHAASITRYVSYFSKMTGVMANLSLTYGSTPSLSVLVILKTAALNPEENKESKSETVPETEQAAETEEEQAASETETEQVTDAVSETETEQVTEAVTETETEQIGEAVPETETEEISEAVTETEQMTETALETETEQLTENTPETEIETVKKENTAQTEAKEAAESVAETETEQITES